MALVKMAVGGGVGGVCGALKDGLTVNAVNAAVCRDSPQRLQGTAHNIQSGGSVHGMLRS